MTVESRFADQHPDPSAQFFPLRLDLFAEFPERLCVRSGRPLPTDSRWCPILAEDLAKGRGPLAGGYPRVCTGDRDRHDVLIILCGRPELIEGLPDLCLVAPLSKGIQSPNLVPFRLGIDLEKTSILAGRS